MKKKNVALQVLSHIKSLSEAAVLTLGTVQNQNSSLHWIYVHHDVIEREVQRKPLVHKDSQTCTICSLLSNTQFIRQQNGS